jgi:uncharacterized LabA/DUF88 family protein
METINETIDYINTHKTPFTVREISNHVGKNPETVRAYIKKLFGTSLISKVGKKGRSQLYFKTMNWNKEKAIANFCQNIKIQQLEPLQRKEEARHDSLLYTKLPKDEEAEINDKQTSQPENLVQQSWLSEAIKQAQTTNMRVMIFIDGSNLFGACKTITFLVDLEKLKDELSKGRRLIRAYYYCSISPTPLKKEIDFINALKYEGFKVVAKTLKKRQYSDGTEYYVEKGVDIALVTDMLRMAYKDIYDVAVLVAGDSDYTDAVEEVKSIGKRAEVAFFETSPDSTSPLISSDLRMSADHFVSLDKIKEKIRR